jgi:DNA polymerase III epsilon subunit-like protein
MGHQASLQCPVCKARFRGHRQCSRCGADLSRLMLVTARAYRLRRQATQALCEARYGIACKLAKRAQNLHDTIPGRKIMLTARVLDMISVRQEHPAGE